MTADERPSVWFFSLDAGSRSAVWGARLLFGLPYHRASMTASHEGDTVRYRSVREAGPCGEARFSGSFRAAGPVFRAAPGTLEHWLTERYSPYSSRGGRLVRGDVSHRPWPLQPSTAEIEENTVTLPIGIRLNGPPVVVHLARRVDVVAGPPLRVG